MQNNSIRFVIEPLELRRLLTTTISLSDDLLHGPGHPQEMTAVGNEIFFFADTGAKSFSTPAPTSLQQLWKSDGTVAGTVRLTSHLHDVAHSTAAVDGLFYFSEGKSIWKSNGT